MVQRGSRSKGEGAGSTARVSARPSRSKQAAIEKLREELDSKLALLTETNRHLKRKIFDLYTIFEISRNFNAVLKYQSLLDTFIYTCIGQVGALKGAIFLKRDGESNRFFLATFKGSGDFPTADQFLQADSNLADYLTKLNRPMLSGDLLNDLATVDEIAIVRKFHPGIIVPLIYQTRLIGIFAMSDKISAREFQMDDLEFLSILANQIAVAIENARLYEAERMASQQLRIAQEQLIQTEKLAALGDMSAKIAHEVNNPLGIIKNYLLLLRRSQGKEVDSTKYMAIVEQEIDRIAAIVRQLLEFHRPRPLVFDKVNVRSILHDVLQLTDRLLTSNRIDVEIEESGEQTILGSADALKQVFLNLIINARDAMPDGGQLTIRTVRSGDHVRIDFHDTGPGISPEIMSKIFDPFFTTKDLGKGTGLGLSVCYGIIKSHEGTITFRNTNPGGCFEIRLPTELKERKKAGSV